MNLFLLIIIFLVGSSSVAFSLKCYQCRSDSNPKCLDPFVNGSVPEQQCPSGSSCLKTKGTKSGVVVVDRECLPGGQTDKCTDETIAGISFEICGCTGELCNAAVLPKSAFWSVSVLLFSAISAVVVRMF